MINSTYFSIVIGIFALAIAISYWERFGERIHNFLFPKKENNEKTHYICPRCGSRNWKFPNPIKPAERMINTYQLVNNLFECKKCGYVGIFFVTSDANNIKFEKLENIKEKTASKVKLKLTGWIIFFVAIAVFPFVTPNILWMVIVFRFIGFLINKYGIARKN